MEMSYQFSTNHPLTSEFHKWHVSLLTEVLIKPVRGGVEQFQARNSNEF